MVEIRGLKKQYKNFQVLKGLNMTINKGDVYGFLGRNGCGKSTTMNILSNIITKDGGEISFGQEKMVIGYLPESPMLYGYMNGYEYLEYIAACCDYKGDINARINEVLGVCGMLEGGKRRIKGYSRGMNQRMGIAATIFNHPDLIILDEPTSALDPQGRAEVMSIIHDLSKLGSTILLCTHILSDVERVANRVGIMCNGVLVEEGYISDLIARAGNNNIQLKIYNSDERAFGLLKDNFGEAFGGISADGVFTLTTDNPQETSEKLVNLLAENKLVPEMLELKKASLEEIYMKAVGESAN